MQLWQFLGDMIIYTAEKIFLSLNFFNPLCRNITFLSSGVRSVQIYRHGAGLSPQISLTNFLHKKFVNKFFTWGIRWQIFSIRIYSTNFLHIEQKFQTITEVLQASSFMSDMRSIPTIGQIRKYLKKKKNMSESKINVITLDNISYQCNHSWTWRT